MEKHLLKFIGQVKSPENDGVGGTFATEYNRIRQQTSVLKRHLSTEAGGLKENAKKNRYKDILPYDQTRVPLTPLTDEYESDYINASFIKGATENRTYIASQGPLRNTVVDFWRMIWQYDVKVIAMACREFETGKKKCECYWAPFTETSIFGSFIVSNLDESCPNEEIIVRNLTVIYNDETRTVSQFQYTAWPDHGIPYTSDGILRMMDMTRITQGNDTAPVLIHCSAGCGRTGVICAIDYVHDLLLTKQVTEDFNIMDLVLSLRKQRPSVVQTKEQYEFLFHTVVQMFEKVLQCPSHNYQSYPKDRLSVCDDVVSVRTLTRLKSTPSSHSSLSQTTSKPTVQPRTSQPPARKMNDTYAVVNKAKLPASSGPPCPPVAIHHYDNAELGGPKNSATALYSTVKPKSRGPAGLLPPAAPNVYDRARPVNHRGAEADPDHGSYELVSGDYSCPSEDTQLTAHLMKGHLECQSSTDDDYEYVSNPIKEPSSYCTPSGMGFNCRIKKPKGPRDPPAEWSRVER